MSSPKEPAPEKPLSPRKLRSVERLEASRAAAKAEADRKARWVAKPDGYQPAIPDLPGIAERPLSARLRAALEKPYIIQGEALPPGCETAADAVIVGWLQRCVEGNAPAIAELLERVEGKVSDAPAEEREDVVTVFARRVSETFGAMVKERIAIGSVLDVPPDLVAVSQGESPDAESELPEADEEGL